MTEKIPFASVILAHHSLSDPIRPLRKRLFWALGPMDLPTPTTEYLSLGYGRDSSTDEPSSKLFWYSGVEHLTATPERVYEHPGLITPALKARAVFEEIIQRATTTEQVHNIPPFVLDSYRHAVRLFMDHSGHNLNDETNS